jgi:hypothetical protein
LNFTFDAEKSIHIPIDITYYTDAPENLSGNVFSKFLDKFQILFYLISTFRQVFWMQLNQIYFEMPMPQQVLEIRVIKPPPWAEVKIMTENISVDIPLNSKNVISIKDPTIINTVKSKTDLIISPLVEAPAESFSILLEVTCPSKGILRKAVFNENIEFTPTYTPKIEIITVNPVKRVEPRAPINITINVKNYGNKITKITPKINEINKSWHSEINPSKIEIPPNSEDNFTLSLISPYEFGWHNEYKDFKITFLSEIYPYLEDSRTYEEIIFIVVNNYGFSTPGFEFPLFITLIIFSIFMLRRRNKGWKVTNC